MALGSVFGSFLCFTEQVTTTYKRLNGGFSHPQQVIKFLLFNPKDK